MAIAEINFGSRAEGWVWIAERLFSPRLNRKYVLAIPIGRLQPPQKSLLRARASFIVGIARCDRDFVHILRSEVFNGAAGRVIVRIAGDGYFRIERTRERRQCAAGLPREPVTAKLLGYFITNMAGALPHMLGVAHAEIDMAHVHVAAHHDPKVIVRHKAARRVTGEGLHEAQLHFLAGEIRGGRWQGFSGQDAA